MSDSQPGYLGYLAPAAMFVGGTALVAATGGGALALGAGALIGTFVADLGKTVITSIMERRAEARRLGKEFALNDTLARTFGRAAGALAKAVAAEATKEGDHKAASVLQNLGEGFEELWVEQMHKRYHEELEGMDGQELARVFSDGLAKREGLPVSDATWQRLIAAKGMPICDHHGNWQIDGKWIDRLVARLTSPELTEAFAHELSYKSEAAAKMSMRLLAELRQAAGDPNLAGHTDATFAQVLSAFDIQFKEYSRQLEHLESVVREEGEKTRQHFTDRLSPTRIPHELPPASLGDFVGRTTELERLVSRLQNGKNTAVVAAAGMGKTALAHEALHEIAPTRESLATTPFPDGIVFLDLYSFRGDANQAWHSLANSLKGPEFLQNSEAHERAAEACRNASFLLTVEGAEEADGSDGRPTLGELLSVLTAQNRWLVLTRNLDQTVASERIEIKDELSQGESKQLFDSLVVGAEIESAVKERVLGLLEGHPLAITWAAGLLSQGIENPVELADDWDHAELPSIRSPKQGEEHKTLRWLFGRSIRRLSAEQRHVLLACGLLARAPFPREVIESVAPNAKAALTALTARSLLRRSPQSGHLEFTHALAYRFARDAETPDSEIVIGLGRWIGEALSNHLAIERGTEGLAEVENLLVHAAALVASDPNNELWIPLVSGMLYENADRIIELGRLDLVSTSFNIAEYWLNIGADPERQDFARDREKSILCNRLGELSTSRESLDQAEFHFLKGFQIATKRADADKSNAQRQRDLAISHLKLGNLARSQGLLMKASEHILAASTISEKLLESNTDNTNYQRDAFISRLTLGDLATSMGNLTEAQKFFQGALAICPPMDTCKFFNSQEQRNRAIAHHRLGNLAASQGKFEEAKNHFLAQLQIAENAATIDPSNSTWRRDISVSLGRLGDLASALGNFDEAFEYIQGDLNIAEFLASSDPSNTEWQRDLSVALNRLANLEAARGNLIEARTLLLTDLDISSRHAKRDPTNTTWQRDLSLTLNLLGDLSISQGLLSEANEYYEEGFQIRKQLASLDENNAEWQRDLSSSQIKMARVARARGDSEGEKKWLEDCFDLLTRMKKQQMHFDPQMEIIYNFLSIGLQKE